MKFHVKFDPKGDVDALDAIRCSLGTIVEIKNYDECIEVHTEQEWVRDEVATVRDHFREKRHAH